MNVICIKSFFGQSMRLLIAAFACTLVLFSNTFPTFAATNSPSSLTKGETHLNEIQRRTDKSTYDPAMSMGEIQKRSDPKRGGINEVQGAADANKMKTPENSQQEVTILDNVKDMLKKVEKE